MLLKSFGIFLFVTAVMAAKPRITKKGPAREQPLNTRLPQTEEFPKKTQSADMKLKTRVPPANTQLSELSNLKKGQPSNANAKSNAELLKNELPNPNSKNLKQNEINGPPNSKAVLSEPKHSHQTSGNMQGREFDSDEDILSLDENSNRNILTKNGKPAIDLRSQSWKKPDLETYYGSTSLGKKAYYVNSSDDEEEITINSQPYHIKKNKKNEFVLVKDKQSSQNRKTKAVDSQQPTLKNTDESKKSKEKTKLQTHSSTSVPGNSKSSETMKARAQASGAQASRSQAFGALASGQVPKSKNISKFSNEKEKKPIPSKPLIDYVVKRPVNKYNTSDDELWKLCRF